MKKNLAIAKASAEHALAMINSYADQIRNIKYMDETVKGNIEFLCGLAYVHSVAADYVLVGIPATTSPTDYEHRAEEKTVYWTQFDLRLDSDSSWFTDSFKLDRNDEEELVIRWSPNEGIRRGIRDLRASRFMSLEDFEEVAECERLAKEEERKNRGRTFENLIVSRTQAKKFPNDVWFKVPDIELFGQQIQVKYYRGTVLKIKQLHDMLAFIDQ